MLRVLIVQLLLCMLLSFSFVLLHRENYLVTPVNMKLPENRPRNLWNSGKTNSFTILPVANGNEPASRNQHNLLIHPLRPYLPKRCG